MASTTPLPAMAKKLLRFKCVIFPSRFLISLLDSDECCRRVWLTIPAGGAPNEAGAPRAEPACAAP
jgi:hypothetical protein